MIQVLSSVPRITQAISQDIQESSDDCHNKLQLVCYNVDSQSVFYEICNPGSGFILFFQTSGFEF